MAKLCMNNTKKTRLILIISIIVLAILFLVALMVGRYRINIDTFFKALFDTSGQYLAENNVIRILRLPRTIIAILVGMSLSVSGLIYQELFQNKLVSPDLLGVSNGAGVGAALAIILGISGVLLSMFAFVLGITTVALTVYISKNFKSKSSMILLLSGIVVGGFMSSILSMLKYFAQDEAIISNITFWLMGSFAYTNMSDVFVLFPIVGIMMTVLLTIKWRINIIALGQEEAKTLGLNYNFYRVMIIAIATLLTASSVAIAGTISWIGLVVPHIVRLVVGRDTKNTIPITIVFGGIFMLICDILSRTFTSSEIPISALTGLIGTPIFIFILLRKRRTLET